MDTTTDLPILLFETPAAWEKWLQENHAYRNGVWIKMAKKATGMASVTHGEALEVALCFGWIDGLRRTCDSSFFLQKFTPRRRKSNWSKRNIQNAIRLMAAGKMQPSGLAEIESARQDGRWER